MERSWIKGRVFVVDDDPLLLGFLEAALAKSGYLVQAFDSARSALLAAGLDKPSIWLIDIRMPDMDGMELLKMLRADEAHRETPVVMLTGDGRLDRIAAAIGAGATTYLLKPFSPQQVVEKVYGVLNLR
ncbi:response regulator [Caulobacter hibisci]|uniref:Response regulator n=1 Tax=Caulobacter hibisci TaxID=2035993 RepID=A0ABS0STK9_9CAUL|nr:response regulator [Caulobacter hibisci]MBI1682992.1 response regulator [Caulobacter hibisci]